MSLYNILYYITEYVNTIISQTRVRKDGEDPVEPLERDGPLEVKHCFSCCLHTLVTRALWVHGWMGGICYFNSVGRFSVVLLKTTITIIIIIIMAEWQLFNVAGYLIEERHRWPIVTASPRGQCSK